MLAGQYQNQAIIDRSLRLKDSSSYDNNKITSIMSTSQDSRAKEEKETYCVRVLNQLMDRYNHKQNNKIASVQPTPKIGEVAEFQSLLNAQGFNQIIF